MLVRVFTLGFDPATERFDDELVRGFLSDKEVASISDHFFVRDGTPYLALVVCYRPSASGPRKEDKGSDTGSSRGRDESWRDALDKADWPLFNRAREWRSERAKAGGIPPYVICNNRQLAEVIRRRPTKLAELAEVDGFGDAKLKKYGAELLAIVARAGTEPETGDDAS
jgi:superfamily II DNA helicase RecQ